MTGTESDWVGIVLLRMRVVAAKPAQMIACYFMYTVLLAAILA